jgi:hypothetical protein
MAVPDFTRGAAIPAPTGEFLRNFYARTAPLNGALNERLTGWWWRLVVPMCDPATSADPAISAAPRDLSRPRWGLLYAATLPQLAALVAIEVTGSPNVVRVALRCMLTVSVFAGMAIWVHRSQAAIDLQQSCACAPATLRVRVIPSRAPAPATAPGEFGEPEPDRVHEPVEQEAELIPS